MSLSRPLFPSDSQAAPVLAVIVALLFMALIAGTMILGHQVQQQTNTRTVTLTLPHGCEAPTRPGEQITIRAHIKPGAVSFAECATRRTGGQ